jgi:uncharacterized protein DUF6328
MHESAKQRTDRQLIELLNELRVALPGAQVLLAFLLIAPFQTHYSRTTKFERSLLYAAVLLTAAGVLLLMAPSVYHRVRWHEGGKEDVVRVGHRLFLIGTAVLALGLLCAVFVVTELIAGVPGAIVATVVVVGIVASTWYVLPIVRGHREDIQRSE